MDGFLGEAMTDADAGRVRMWRRGAVAYVALDRPHKANSYTPFMVEQLEGLLRSLSDEATVRVVVITGTGERAFCAGADRDGLRSRDPLQALDLPSARVFHFLACLPKATIAAINGAAVGGGLELALACDVRLASRTARFAMPEPTLGIIPAAGGTLRLPSVVGVGRAKELIVGGAVWDAQQALAAGLVSAVTDPETLLETAQAWAERIVGRDPVAVRLAKQALQCGQICERWAAFEAVAQAFLDLRRLSSHAHAPSAIPMDDGDTLPPERRSS